VSRLRLHPPAQQGGDLHLLALPLRDCSPSAVLRARARDARTVSAFLRAQAERLGAASQRICRNALRARLTVEGP
jgi:hypothetical protein